MDFSDRKYTYAIVDSKSNDSKELKQQLDKYGYYSCVGVAQNEVDGINIIIDQKPQLVFFDPQIGVGNSSNPSFNVIHELHQFMDELPKFVATSITTDHSYQAIKNGVFDYILKPFNHYELKKSLMRFEKNQPAKTSICLKSFTEFRFLLVNDIVYLKADNNTTDFYLTDGSMVTSFKTLKSFEAELPNVIFRIHKSYMININYISKIHFSKFQCSLKFTKKLIPFSQSLKATMHEIKDLWIKGKFEGLQQQINLV